MMSAIEIKAHNPDCIRLVQITDTHIFKRKAECFDGVDTAASLDQVIEHIRREVDMPDFVMVTGDLVHDPVPEAYERLRQQLSGLGAPVFCLPGNHDDPVLMHQMLNQDNIHTTRVLEAGRWGILLLDTCLTGTHSGRLQVEELNFLDQHLAEFNDRPVLIGLHHSPVSVTSPWLNAMMLENPEDMFSILDRHGNVRALIWGHIHQVFRAKRLDVILAAGPSSCVQFKPESEKYIKDDLNPGYSVLELYQDGSIDIRIQRI